MSEQEAEDFILARDIFFSKQISWGIVEFDSDLIPKGSCCMVYKPE